MSFDKEITVDIEGRFFKATCGDKYSTDETPELAVIRLLTVQMGLEINYSYGIYEYQDALHGKAVL